MRLTREEQTTVRGLTALLSLCHLIALGVCYWTVRHYAWEDQVAIGAFYIFAPFFMAMPIMFYILAVFFAFVAVLDKLKTFNPYGGY